jgi:hypothetical protein
MQYASNSNIVFEYKYKFEFKCLTSDVILTLCLIRVQTHVYWSHVLVIETTFLLIQSDILAVLYLYKQLICINAFVW